MGIQVSYQFKGRWIIRQFDADRVVIGRPNSQHSVDIDLSPDTTVSRLHARIWTENGQFWVDDVESRYGTLVNGKKLIGKIQIQPEDTIVIGETTLKVDDLPKTEA
jgi:pSer/pThr/pTyr-binding forkhead associated (FHA) protein